MKTEPKAMQEIHKIQEGIYNEQREMSDKEKIQALHREAQETKVKLGLNFRQAITGKL